MTKSKAREILTKIESMSVDEANQYYKIVSISSLDYKWKRFFYHALDLRKEYIEKRNSNIGVVFGELVPDECEYQ